VLYIAGLGRSGSTLLERTLGRLPSTVAVGEVVHLWERGVLEDERCGCGVPFHRCEFWTAVGDRAYGGWDRVDVQGLLAAKRAVDRNRFTPLLASGRGTRGFREQLALFRAAVTPLYRAVLEVSGADVVLDSSKHASYAYVLQGIRSLDLRVVHAVRDAPAVAYSWSKVVERPDADQTLMARWSPTRTAIQWMTQNVLADGLRLTGVPTEVVRYEDFVSQPAEVVGRLVGFADLPPAADLLAALRAGHVDLAPDHTVSGNPMRFRSGRVEIRADTAWRSAMPASERRLVAALTAPARLRFRYLPTRD
jgi:hypothetical protein